MVRKVGMLAALTAGIVLAELGLTPASAQGWRSGAVHFVQGEILAERAQYRHRGYRRGIDPGTAAAIGIIGFAAGLIASGALAPPPYVAADPNWIAYCARKYRSFDPASGTYLGRDGDRHYCQ